MKTVEQEIVWIEVGKLVSHPKNANVMSKQLLQKLKKHIKRSGRYEPLVVRVHPTLKGRFELINGHHRKIVLEQLGEKQAACVVWDLDDAQTLMLLATVNRLSGQDAAGKRLSLIESLGEQMSTSELAGLLPEEEDVLRAALERDENLVMQEPLEISEMQESFTVFLKAGDKKNLVAALKKCDPDPGKALLTWMEKLGNQ